MYNNWDKEKYVDHFSQIIELCISAKINLHAITEELSRSKLVCDIEKCEYHLMYENTPYQNFKSIFPNAITEDNSYHNYNDAYWCGYVYMNLLYEYNKPLTYIFYVMPLKTLLDLYSLYHEMDISQIFAYFEMEERRETLLSRLIAARRITAAKLSTLSNVSVKTIYHYKENNQYLYKASFQIIMKLAKALDVNPTVFLEHL